MPNPSAKPVNQLAVSGNACGPAALLYAFEAGNEHWQRAAAAVPGSTDRERIAQVIRRHALHPSRHLRNHRRWSPAGGVGVADLADMADEMTRGHHLPGVRTVVLVAARPPADAALLGRLHRQLAESFRRGLPPVLALKRMAQPAGAGPEAWAVVDGHFVVVTSVPGRLEHGAGAFEFSYFDPHGARHCRGVLRVPVDHGSPWLEADCPETPVGRRMVRAGHRSILTASAMIGRF